MQGEQRERLLALAAQVAVENDPQKFHALLLQLNQMLRQDKMLRKDQTQSKENTAPSRGDRQASDPPPKS